MGGLQVIARTQFKRRMVVAVARQDRSDEFASFKARPASNAVMATPESISGSRPRSPAIPAKLSRKARTDHDIRDAARGEPCTIRMEGICNGDPATSVWAHWPGLDGDRGMGIKALDICGAVACFACHEVLDGRRPRQAGVTREAVMLDFLFGLMRSLVMLARKGIV